jgi:hypothetical protein
MSRRDRLQPLQPGHSNLLRQSLPLSRTDTLPELYPGRFGFLIPHTISAREPDLIALGGYSDWNGWTGVEDSAILLLKLRLLGLPFPMSLTPLGLRKSLRPFLEGVRGNHVSIACAEARPLPLILLGADGNRAGSSADDAGVGVSDPIAS